ncbi:MAG: hypothetical protein LIO49_06000 [Ruminococcus sp.]|nr:hypothetical protein [Ruminococcus sp.]
MEIIVGTFFIIYLIVFLCREGIKSFGKDKRAVALGFFDAFSVLALWLAIDYVIELNDVFILYMI